MIPDDAHSEAEAVAAILERASDFQIRLMMDTLQRRLSAVDYDPDAVLAGFPTEALRLPTDEVLAWSERADVAETRIDAEKALPLARMLLLSAWEAPALRSMAEAAIRHPEDDRLGSGVTFKLGTLATVLMLVASTSFDLRLPGVVLHKAPLTPETIASLAKLVEDICMGAHISVDGKARHRSLR